MAATQLDNLKELKERAENKLQRAENKLHSLRLRAEQFVSFSPHLKEIFTSDKLNIKARQLSLGKILYSQLRASQLFLSPKAPKNLAQLLGHTFLIAHPNLENEDKGKVSKKITDFYDGFYVTNNCPGLELTNNTKKVLLLNDILTYCEIAEKSTESFASQSSIALFIKDANDHILEHDIHSFFQAVTKKFCVSSDKVLTTLQESIVKICEPFGTPTDMQTLLLGTKKIGNRHEQLTLSIKSRFKEVKQKVWIGKTELEEIRNSAKIQNIKEDPAAAVLFLREQRKKFNIVTRGFSEASISIMEAINGIVDPFLESTQFSQEELKKFVDTFCKIPYSSESWLKAFNKLIGKFEEDPKAKAESKKDDTAFFKDLDTEDKIKIIEAAVKRAGKKNGINKAIPFLVQKTTTFSGSEADIRLTEIIKEHNRLIDQNEPRQFRYKVSGALRSQTIPQEKIQEFSRVEDLYNENRRQEEARENLVSTRIAQRLEEEFEIVPANTLEERVKQLEKSLEGLSPSDARNAFSFLLTQGKMTLALQEKRQEIQRNKEAKIFYNHLLHGLTITLAGARALASGDVGRRNQKTHIAGTAVRFLGEVFSLPFVSSIATGAGNLIEFFGEYKTAQDADILSQLTNTQHESELLAEKITLGLASKLKDHLGDYTEESVKAVAEYCKERFKTLFIGYATAQDRDDLEKSAEKYIQKILEPYEPAPLEAIYDHFAYRLKPKNVNDRDLPTTVLGLLERARNSVNSRNFPRNKIQMPVVGKGKEEADERSSPEKQHLVTVIKKQEARIEALEKELRDSSKEFREIVLAHDKEIQELNKRWLSTNKSEEKVKSPEAVVRSPVRKSRSSEALSPAKRSLQFFEAPSSSVSELALPPKKKALTPEEKASQDFNHFSKSIEEFLDTEEKFCSNLTNFVETLQQEQNKKQIAATLGKFTPRFEEKIALLETIKTNPFAHIEAQDLLLACSQIKAVLLSEEYRARIENFKRVVQGQKELNEILEAKKAHSLLKSLLGTHVATESYSSAFQRILRYPMLLENSQTFLSPKDPETNRILTEKFSATVKNEILENLSQALKESRKHAEEVRASLPPLSPIQSPPLQPKTGKRGSGSWAQIFRPRAQSSEEVNFEIRRVSNGK